MHISCTLHVYFFLYISGNCTTVIIKGRLHEDELLSLDALLIDDAEKYERGASMFQLIDRSRGIITGSSSQTTAGGEARTLQKPPCHHALHMEQLDLTLALILPD
jgi:hypothetical protein